MLSQEVMMKKLLITAIVCCITSITIAQATLEVYESDGKTAFDGRDIMVGTKLTFVVSLDSTDYWSGGLFITGNNRFLGELIGRDYDPNTRDWTGSYFDNAGEHAKVTSWNDSEIWGYDLYGSDVNNSIGDWFIIDYEAIGVGDPNVWFCDYDVSWDNPVSFETFTQVPSRDFNNDDIVNYSDFSIFNTHWLSDDCSDPDWCDETDINTGGIVDADDLILFADFWLWGAEYTAIPDDPNVPEPDSDFIYSIVDPSGLDEITLTTGESVTLYIEMEMTDPNNIMYGFDAEVNISDPNLGSIDNTEHPSGTAQILVEPRSEGFDYWGPGDYQQEGIQFFFASIGTLISEGNMVSFEYTCQTTGDVILELVNPGTTNIQYKEILIHQVATASQSQSQSMSMQPGAISIQQSTSTNEENAAFLERIWIEEEEIRERYTKEEWDTFVESVRNAK